jgi:hypothetical protein
VSSRTIDPTAAVRQSFVFVSENLTLPRKGIQPASRRIAIPRASPHTVEFMYLAKGIQCSPKSGHSKGVALIR